METEVSASAQLSSRMFIFVFRERILYLHLQTSYNCATFWVGFRENANRKQLFQRFIQTRLNYILVEMIYKQSRRS